MIPEKVYFDLRLENSKTVGFTNCTWKSVPHCRTRDREASNGNLGFRRRHYEQSLVWRTQCADRHVWLQHIIQIARMTVLMCLKTQCGHFDGDPSSNPETVKSMKQIYGVLVTFAYIANRTCQTVLHELQFFDYFIAGPVQQRIAVVNWPDDAASHYVCDVRPRIRDVSADVEVAGSYNV